VVDENAMADVSGRLVLTEGRAGSVRGQLEQVMGQDQFKMIVQRIANGFFSGIAVKESRASDFDLDTAKFEVFFSGTSKNFAQRKKNSDTITFRGVIPPLDLAKNLVHESERKFPMRASWADDITTWSVLKVTLPEYEDVRLPDSVALATPYGSYNLTYRLDGRTLTIERRLVAVAMDISPERYAAFAALCKKIDDAEKRQVVIKLKSK